MSNIIQAIEQLAHAHRAEALTAFSTLAMWAIMGAVVASSIAHYIPGDLGVVTFLVGAGAGLGAAALIKSL